MGACGAGGSKSGPFTAIHAGREETGALTFKFHNSLDDEAIKILATRLWTNDSRSASGKGEMHLEILLHS